MQMNEYRDFVRMILGLLLTVHCSCIREETPGLMPKFRHFAGE